MPLTPAEKQKNYREKLKANNPEKYEEIKKNAAENALRHKKQIDETNENCKNVIRLKQLENSKTSTDSEEASMMRQNTAEYTPRKRVEKFISENISHIETPKKEVIKQKLLEHDVLTEALKLEMKSSNQAEKKNIQKSFEK
ncbi:unnamed protein product [Parnassius apollo]|uniref:(apollo) hypothetical protein n=1 Tax=Parnassius apollo TaxID=110799 RepID=A0A8S3WY87_PARAO|nr:unnamed protein product [Parnassius apollo]